MAISLLYDIAINKMGMGTGYMVKCSIPMGINKGLKFRLIAIDNPVNNIQQSEFYQMDVLFVFDKVNTKMDLDEEFMAKFINRI